METKLSAVKLATNDKSKILVLSNFCGNQGDPYQCEVDVYSFGFGYKGSFYFDNYSEFVASLEKMSASLSGSAELRENYKDQYIKLEILKLGQVLVSGKIERHGDHSQTLSFGFKTDQTCLATFGKELRRVLG
jgi:hypothetical protein